MIEESASFKFHSKLSWNTKLGERLEPLSKRLREHKPGTKAYARVVAQAIDWTIEYYKEKERAA